MTVKINIDNKTIIRIMLVIVFFLLSLQFLSELGHALTLVFVAFFLALALNPPVSMLAKKLFRGNRAAGTGIAYLIVITIIGLFLWALVPPLVKESSKFLDNVPQYVDDLREGDNAVSNFVNKYDLDEEIEDFGNNLADRIGDANGPLLSGINRVGQTIISILTVLVLTFFMLVEGPYWLDKFWQFQHPKKRKHRQELAIKMYNVVTGYVNGQLLIAMMSGFAALIVMLIVGIPFALPLAGIVALFGLIPLVGATLGAAVVVVISLFQSVSAAVIMAVFFLVYQQIENNVIQPFIQSKALDVSPLIVFVSVIFGVSVGGLLGGFVAIPLAAIVKILFLDYNKTRVEKIKQEQVEAKSK